MMVTRTGGRFPSPSCYPGKILWIKPTGYAMDVLIVEPSRTRRRYESVECPLGALRRSKRS